MARARARRGTARLGSAWRGMAWHGWARNRRGPGEWATPEDTGIAHIPTPPGASSQYPSAPGPDSAAKPSYRARAWRGDHTRPGNAEPGDGSAGVGHGAAESGSPFGGGVCCCGVTRRWGELRSRLGCRCSAIPLRGCLRGLGASRAGTIHR